MRSKIARDDGIFESVQQSDTSSGLAVCSIPEALVAAIKDWRTNPPAQLRAISVHQPWAYNIINGTKRIENRTWPTRERGWRLIHAGKAYQAEAEEAIRLRSPGINVQNMIDSPRGGIVGIVRLVDCVDVAVGSDNQRRIGGGYVSDRIAVDQRIWTASSPEHGDKIQRKYAFQLADPWRFPQMIPYRGQLGFFKVTPEVAEHVLRILNSELDCDRILS